MIATGAEDASMPKRSPLTLGHLDGFHVTQCILVEWLVEEGGPVVEGDPVATVETRKVTAEIKAGIGGVLRHKYGQGEYADIDDMIGWIEQPAGSRGR